MAATGDADRAVGPRAEVALRGRGLRRSPRRPARGGRGPASAPTGTPSVKPGGSSSAGGRGGPEHEGDRQGGDEEAEGVSVHQGGERWPEVGELDRGRYRLDPRRLRHGPEARAPPPSRAARRLPMDAGDVPPSRSLPWPPRRTALRAARARRGAARRRRLGRAAPAGVAAPASASSNEGEFLTRLNLERQARRPRPPRVRPRAGTDVAQLVVRTWRRRGVLSHDPNLAQVGGPGRARVARRRRERRRAATRSSSSTTPSWARPGTATTS